MAAVTYAENGLVGTAETLDAIGGIVSYDDGKLQLVHHSDSSWNCLAHWHRIISSLPE
jgi:hypothetical protein